MFRIHTLLIIAFALPGKSDAQPSASVCNDSARYYFERSKTKIAASWAERALKSSPGVDDAARSHVISGMILEEEGYLAAALEQYRTGRQTRSTKVEAAALNGIASVLVTSGVYDSIIFYLKKSRALDTTAANVVMNYQAEAKYWQSQNEYDQSLTALQRALDNAEEVGDNRNKAIILSSIGSIYFSHEPDKTVARDYFLRSNALCDSSIHYNILARNYGRLANTAMASNDYEKGKYYLNRAKKITDLSDNLFVRSYILSSIAITLFDEGKYNEVIEFMKEPIRIRRELGQTRQLQNDLLNISETYMMVKMYDKAEEALTEGGAISQKLNDVVYLKYFYERASMLDSLRGNYRGAYRNLKKAMAYKDSTFSRERLRDVREVQEKYETEQKEKIIAEKELVIEQQKYRQAVLLGGSVVSVLILVVVLVIIRARNRQKLLNEREQQNHLRLQTIVKTQEDVQQRIARDLHDGLVQVLGAAKMSLQSVGPDSDKTVLQKHIRDASDIMDEAVTEARSISHQILPYSLLKDGLVSALEDLFARGLASFEFNHDGEKINVSEQVSINIYRIAQELVNNVQKHAESAHVTVSLKLNEGHLHFTFSDNGPGYDSGRLNGGAGLSNMTTRAELIGGFLEMNSIVGKGSKTELIVPL
jgi:signal transduction histidine kinase